MFCMIRLPSSAFNWAKVEIVNVDNERMVARSKKINVEKLE